MNKENGMGGSVMSTDNQSAQSALLPCPFCGNAGTRDPRHTYSTEGGKCRICCGQCGAHGPWQWARADGEAKALEAWNTRALAQAPAPSGEAPDGYSAHYVKGIEAMFEALARADRKGYMPDALRDAWAEFDYVAAPKGSLQMTEQSGGVPMPEFAFDPHYRRCDDGWWRSVAGDRVKVSSIRNATPPTPEQAGPSGEALTDASTRHEVLAEGLRLLALHPGVAQAGGRKLLESAAAALASPGATPRAPIAWLKPGTNLVVHRDVKSSTNNGHEFTQALVLASPGAMAEQSGEALPTEFHDALKGLAYSAMSWNGFNVFGDEKSIREAARTVHVADTAPQLQDEIKRLRSTLAAPGAMEGAQAAQPECNGLDTPERVRFYEHDFYPLSNFSAFRVTVEGVDFDTSEAAYHWHKFPQQAGHQMAIRAAASAHHAFKLAERWRADRRPDWDNVKVDVMRRILRAKVEQHEYVRRKLLATGERELVEDSWRDDFWGWGPNRDGQNMLGKLWMELRAELRAHPPTGEPT